MAKVLYLFISWYNFSVFFIESYLYSLYRRRNKYFFLTKSYQVKIRKCHVTSRILKFNCQNLMKCVHHSSFPRKIYGLLNRLISVWEFTLNVVINEMCNRFKELVDKGGKIGLNFYPKSKAAHGWIFFPFCFFQLYVVEIVFRNMLFVRSLNFFNFL